MGSKNSDGSDITQSRKTVRKIGSATTFSSDRSETDIQRDGTVEPGTGVDRITVTYSTTSQGDAIKTSTNDGLVYRDDDGEIVSLEQDDIDPYANGGGGGVAPTLAEVITSSPILPEGNSMTIPAGGQFYLNAETDADVELIVNEDETYIHHSLRASLDTPTASVVCDSSEDPNEAGVRLSSEHGIYLSGPQKLTRYHTESVTLSNLGEVTLGYASGVIVVVKGTGTRTVKLPANGVDMDLLGGETFYIKDGDGTASSGNIAIHANGSTLDGQASGVLDTNYESRTVVYNGSEWNNI